MEKSLKLVLILFILTSSVSVFYYFVIYMPGLSTSMMEQPHKAQETNINVELSNAEKLEKCLNDVYKEYDVMWNNQCQILDLREDCELPDLYAKRVDDHLAKKEDHCRYKFDWEDEEITKEIIHP